MTRIESAAVKFQLVDDREIIIPCHRHCDAYEIMTIMKCKYIAAVEGFLDSNNRFLSRREAYDIAEAAGQIIHPYIDTNRELFSEELW